MGTTPAQKQLSTELSNVESEVEEYYQQYYEIRDCCGYKYKKSIKTLLKWQNNFITNCSDLKNIYKWASLMIDFIKDKKVGRIKYIREINDIKFQQQRLSHQQTLVMLNHQETKKFKENLKRSVLLSFKHTKNNQHKDENNLQSVIIGPTGSNKGKQTNNYLQQFNRSTIVKQNLRNSQASSERSFLDDTITAIFRNQEEEISKKRAFELQVFMKFTMVLEKHLNDNNHKLNHIIQIFCEHVYQSYSKAKILTAYQINELVKEIKIFLILLRNSVEDFYNTKVFLDMDEKCNYLITNSENILTTVTTILFNNTTFYNHIYSIIKGYNYNRESSFRQILSRLTQKHPQEFDISIPFCLNDLTVKNYIDSMSVESGIENLEAEGLNSIDEDPYIPCIETLQRISKAKTPVSKMKVIMQCSEQITECISTFYETNKMQVKQKIMDADQVLSIFCYIISKARIQDMHTHMFLLENFATENQMISATGYYYSVINAAIEQLEITNTGQN